jgi:hypothetical protein
MNRENKSVMSRRKKTFLSIFLVAMTCLSSTAVLDGILRVMPGSKQLHDQCENYLENWTVKAVVTCGVTKSINATLSVVEDSQIVANVLGVGVNVALGEVVRPPNDLIAKVADVSLASAVSLGLQRILLEIGAWIGLRIFLSISCLCVLFSFWVSDGLRPKFISSAKRFLGLAVLTKVLIPSTILLTAFLGSVFMEASYVAVEKDLGLLKAQTKELNMIEQFSGTSEKSGFFENIKSKFGDFRGQIDSVVERWANLASAHSRVAVTSIVVFIFQTMIMPVLILWILVRCAGSYFGTAIQQKMLPSWFSSPNRNVHQDRHISPNNKAPVGGE